ncbi:MAG: hypothetical protein P4L67_00390 [Candidatus Pacebacteria bacterium]|nr:hypothetical protein [Candidatus Paceibacterota bacterium]
MAITEAIPIPTTEALICRWKTLAARAAEGTDKMQFYLTLGTSLMTRMLKPPSGAEASGYVKSAQSRRTDMVECQIAHDLNEHVPTDQRAGALAAIVKTFLQEAKIF